MVRISVCGPRCIRVPTSKKLQISRHGTTQKDAHLTCMHPTRSFKALEPSPDIRTPQRCFRLLASRSADLLAALVGLIGAHSMLPPDVESAAATLRAVLIGRTAQIATKTLSGASATARAASTGAAAAAAEAERNRTGWPATAVGEALLLWKEGGGLMQVIGNPCLLLERVAWPRRATPLDEI